MYFLESLRNYSWGNNTGEDFFWAIVIFVAVIIVLKLFQVVVLSRLRKFAKKTKTDFDDMMIEVFDKIKPPFYFFVALYLGLKIVSLPETADKIINVLILIYIIYEVVRAIQKMVDYFLKKYLSKSKENQKENRAMLHAINLIVKIVLWALALVLILSNMSIDVTSLIAGLGIGGIAIALAAQNVLGDLFSSFSIYIDKPFQVGDHIQVGTDMGTVEKIGMKSTRLRTLQGEELVISNKELTSVRVGNFKKLEKRREHTSLGVVYGTPVTVLRSIPKMLKEIVEKQKKAEFSRCYFKEFAASSLNFELVYYVDSDEFDEFAKIKERINYDIYSRFEKEGIEFAYPTQTLFVNKEEE